MDRTEFMSKLSALLGNVPSTELEKAIQYSKYEEEI